MRGERTAAGLLPASVELLSGDLTDAAALVRLVEGVDAVVHLAGAVRGCSREHFYSINESGTGNLLAALGDAEGSPRLLLVSSLAAREPGLSWYAASKRAAERLLERTGSPDWIILRPPAVYGPGDREMLPVFRLMARGLAPVPGSPRARLSLIHVDDLAAAAVACLRSAASSRRILELGDGAPGGYDWSQLAEAVESVTGRRVRLWPVPAALLDGIARLNLGLSRATGRAAMLTPAKLRELRHPDWVVDNGPISEFTGWRPAVDLRSGLAELLGGPQ